MCSSARSIFKRGPTSLSMDARACCLRALRGGADERLEHGEAGIVGVLAVVPAPHVFVDVAGKPRFRDAVMHAADRVFEHSEEPVDGLRVNVALDVDAGGVIDAAVVEVVASEAVIA